VPATETVHIATVTNNARGTVHTIEIVVQSDGLWAVSGHEDLVAEIGREAWNEWLIDFWSVPGRKPAQRWAHAA
jgi:hypothetical protein